MLTVGCDENEGDENADMLGVFCAEKDGEGGAENDVVDWPLREAVSAAVSDTVPMLDGDDDSIAEGDTENSDELEMVTKGDAEALFVAIDAEGSGEPVGIRDSVGARVGVTVSRDVSLAVT